MKSNSAFMPAVVMSLFLGACAATTGHSDDPASDADPATYAPPFAPGQLKGHGSGSPNEVLVLGTMHLSGLGDEFKPQQLEPLLDRLAAWAPTAIASENLSGLQCDSLRRYPSRYAETVEWYCPDPTTAGKAVGLDAPKANAEAERMLRDWPLQPAASDRRRLALVFLAAGEPGSALVQWLQLPTGERVPEDGLNDELVIYLNERIEKRNETNLIAAALAARLGLERLWSVDDHSADPVSNPDPDFSARYSEAMNEAWDNPATEIRMAEAVQLQANLSEEDGLMEMYRRYNAPDQPLLVYKSDFGATLREPSEEGFGRIYVGYWETRNLRMVANIRDVLAQKPGTKLLAIVGASHKGYYEAYLDMMHDVELVDTLTILE